MLLFHPNHGDLYLLFLFFASILFCTGPPPRRSRQHQLPLAVFTPSGWFVKHGFISSEFCAKGIPKWICWRGKLPSYLPSILMGHALEVQFILSRSDEETQYADFKKVRWIRWPKVVNPFRGTYPEQCWIFAILVQILFPGLGSKSVARSGRRNMNRVKNRKTFYMWEEEDIHVVFRWPCVLVFWLCLILSFLISLKCVLSISIQGGIHGTVEWMQGLDPNLQLWKFCIPSFSLLVKQCLRWFFCRYYWRDFWLCCCARFFLPCVEDPMVRIPKAVANVRHPLLEMAFPL